MERWIYPVGPPDSEAVQKLFTIKGRDALETLVKLRDELDTFNVSKASGSFDKCLQTILVWLKGSAQIEFLHNLFIR